LHNNNTYSVSNKPPINKNSTDNLRIYHQNVRGLHNKVDELTTHWLNHFPHILCTTEHHLRDFDIDNICINNYNLGAFCCRKSRKHGGVSIFVHDTLTYTNIDINKYCNEFDLEACALKLKMLTTVFYILCIYRPPTSNFLNFLCLLKSTLLQLYLNTTNLIICGDININYLKTSNYKTQLDNLLTSYNLSTAVDFPTRITKNTSTAIDNIFIDKTKNSDYTIEPIINGLSDHDAQVLVLHNIKIINQKLNLP
jgi:exonuclease III